MVDKKKVKPKLMIKKKSKKEMIESFIKEKENGDYFKENEDTTLEAYYLEFDDLIFDIGTYFKCINCGSYAGHFTCPPITPKSYRSNEILKKYDNILFLVLRKDMKKINDNLDEKEKEWKKPNFVIKLLYAQAQASRTLVHRIFNIVLETRNYIKDLGYDVKGFQSGGCRLCTKKGCALVTKEKCRHPEKLIPPPESYGIDLYTTCLKSGIDIQIPPRDNMTLIGMILYK